MLDPAPLHRVQQKILLPTGRSVSGRSDTSAQTVPHFQLRRRSMRRNCSTVFYLSTERVIGQTASSLTVSLQHAACQTYKDSLGSQYTVSSEKFGICLRNPQTKIEHIRPNRFPSRSGLSIQHVRSKSRNSPLDAKSKAVINSQLLGSKVPKLAPCFLNAPGLNGMFFTLISSKLRVQI